MNELERWLDVQIDEVVDLEDRLLGNNSEFNFHVIEAALTSALSDVHKAVAARGDAVLGPLCDRVLDDKPASTLLRATLSVVDNPEDTEQRLFSAIHDVDVPVQKRILDALPSVDDVNPIEFALRTPALLLHAFLLALRSPSAVIFAAVQFIDDDTPESVLWAFARSQRELPDDLARVLLNPLAAWSRTSGARFCRYELFRQLDDRELSARLAVFDDQDLWSRCGTYVDQSEEDDPFDALFTAAAEIDGKRDGHLTRELMRFQSAHRRR